MRKTILMLLNGFGVERSDSTEVYSAKLMPNLDSMTKNFLFGTLTATAGDYLNGYKDFSIAKSKNKEDEIDDLIFEKKLGQNAILNKPAEVTNNENTIHIFYPVHNEMKFNQVKEIIKILNKNKDKKVFVHLILTATATSDYDVIEKIVSKIAFETNGYCKIGFIVGKNKIGTDDALRVFYRELGEHWNETAKKIAILRKEIVPPEDAGIFIVGTGFAFKENDTIFFMNYENIDMGKFYTDYTKVKVNQFSLYPYKENIPHAFTKADEGLLNTSIIAEKNNIKLLVLTENQRVNDINFYLNGMQKKLSPVISYAVNDINLFNSKNNIIKLISENEYDGIIIDYHLGIYKKLSDIKQVLANADSIIKNISDASLEKDYTFIVSSLYGMHAPVMDGVLQKVVNFSGKVPVVFQSNLFRPNDYTLNAGSTYALSQTFLTNICDEVKSNKLIHKKGAIDKILSKK